MARSFKIHIVTAETITALETAVNAWLAGKQVSVVSIDITVASSLLNDDYIATITYHGE